MVKLYETGAYLLNGSELVPDDGQAQAVLASKGVQTSKEDASKNTMAYGILEAHNTSGNMEQLKIKFDKMTSHDITFVGIIQPARASGLTEFPIPYVLTNCHNSLCAVGGTINEDDHVFGLSCAKKYGGIYVPPRQAVIHQFAREMLAGGGKMILGSDPHSRYGALGTMAVGEGGPELVKQLLSKTYDIDMPGVVGLYLLCAGGKATFGKGELLALACSVGFAIHILVIDKYSAIVDGVKLSCAQFFVSGIISVILMIIFDKPSIHAIMSAAPYLLYTGILSCGVAFTFQTLGQRDSDPTVASLLLCLESVFAVIFAWVLIDQKMSVRELSGCIIMFVAIVLAQLPADVFKKKQRA